MAFNPGFDPAEAIDMLALCAYAETDAAEAPIPDPRTGWDLLFDSPIMGPFQNKWQLWRQHGPGKFAIALRGTVPSASSVFEDLVVLMIPGAGAVTVGGGNRLYRFAADPEAGVHFGFALGALFLFNEPTEGIGAQLRRLVPAASDIFVAGHSQGAAVATLLRSYVHYNPAEMPANCAYKTYVFAQPRPGNNHYAEDFERTFCAPRMAFRVTNTLDWVPEVPFTLQGPADLDKPNPLSVWLSAGFVGALISKGIADILSLLEHHTRARMQPAAAAAIHPNAAAADWGAGALAAAPLQTPLLPTLNYVNVGTEVPLLGAPAGGTDATDFLFEHHATTYFRLLVPPPPAATPASPVPAAQRQVQSGR